MPNVLPTIPNSPPQGIQALLDKVYLWNPDVSNDLIEKINALLDKLGDAIGAIRPYNELVAPINQYEPCYYGDGVYVAKNYLAERAEEFNEEEWILIARKEITADEIQINFAGQEDTLQNAIDTLKTDQDELGDQVSGIESKIPESASETNPLVTKGDLADIDLDDYAKKDDLSDYLPLSGGTLTGGINASVGLVGFSYDSHKPLFTATWNSVYGSTLTDMGLSASPDGLVIGQAKSTRSVLIQNNGILRPNGLNKEIDLGRSDMSFKTFYVTELRNGTGGTLTVPTTAGTIARIEDIDTVVGDISTALTAILGE